MSNQMDLKDEIKAEKKKFGKMSLDQKLTYIKDYYSFHILAVIVIIILGISIYQTVQSKNYDTILQVTMVNNDTSVWDEDVDSYENAMSKPFEEYLGIDGVNERILVDNNYVLDYEGKNDLAIFSAETLVAMIYAANLDVYIGDQPALDYFCEDDDTFFYNLNDIFDAAFIDKFEDQLVYHTYADGTKVPIAFDISENKLVKDAKLTLNPVYICVFANTTRLDTSVEYIKFILENQ